MKRVLVILPFYGGSLPIGRYAAQALEEAGCIVRTFESPEFFSAFTALKNLKVGMERQEFLENSFLQNVSQAVLGVVEAFRPDLVLSMAQAPLSRQALKRLRADGVHTAMWFVEDYRLFTYWQAFAPLYDIFAVIQKEPFFTRLAEIGQKNALYLPLAALPELHRPMKPGPAEERRFGSDISFLGAGYPNRRKLFERLGGFNFKIWGTEWEGAPGLASLVQEGGRRISPEEAVMIYNATTVNINLHSSVERGAEVGHGDFVNPRTFELAACKAFQLVDRRSLMPEHFADGELAVFETPDELLEMIRYYLENPGERAEIARRGYERVMAEHTYAKRMQTLLDFAAARLPNFGQLAKPEWHPDLPENTRNELTILVNELGLPADCSFDDIVAGVRSKSGELGETEAALLFLHEWKKQYIR